MFQNMQIAEYSTLVFLDSKPHWVKCLKSLYGSEVTKKFDRWRLRGHMNPVAVLGKVFGGPARHHLGRQQRLSEITIEPIKNLGGLGKIWGARAPWPQHGTATAWPNAL